MTKTGSDFCKLLYETTEEDEEDLEEVTTSLSAAKQISIDAVVAIKVVFFNLFNWQQNI